MTTDLTNRKYSAIEEYERTKTENQLKVLKARAAALEIVVNNITASAAILNDNAVNCLYSEIVETYSRKLLEVTSLIEIIERSDRQ